MCPPFVFISIPIIPISISISYSFTGSSRRLGKTKFRPPPKFVPITTPLSRRTRPSLLSPFSGSSSPPMDVETTDSSCIARASVNAWLQKAYRKCFISERYDDDTPDDVRTYYLFSKIQLFHEFWMMYYTHVATCKPTFSLQVVLNVDEERDKVAVEIKQPIHVNIWRVHSRAFKLLVERLVSVLLSRQSVIREGSSKEEHNAFISLMVSVTHVIIKHSFRKEQDFDLLSTGVTRQQCDILLRVADIEYPRMKNMNEMSDLLYQFTEIYVTFVSEVEDATIKIDGCKSRPYCDEYGNIQSKRKKELIKWMVTTGTTQRVLQFMRFNRYSKVANKISKAIMKRGEEADICVNCGRMETMSQPSFPLCGRCRQIKYCSVDCRNQHWPQHKKNCHKRICDEDCCVLPGNSA